MVLNRIWKDEISGWMEKAEVDNLGPSAFGWSKKKETLVFVEKKDSVYKVYGVKGFYADDAIQKICASAVSESGLPLFYAIKKVLTAVSSQSIGGIPIRDPHTLLEMLLTAKEGKGKVAEVVVPVQEKPVNHDYGSIIGYVCNEKLETTNTPIFLSEDMLLHHVIITGSTGGGKTEVAKRIVSEAQRLRKKVLVLTPEPHLWTSIENSGIVSEAGNLNNEINILDFSYAENLSAVSALQLEAILELYGKMEQTSNLRLLLVVDEVHVFLEDREYEAILERATRILRKFGVGCVLISHTYADFNRGIRANVQTHIAMYTNWQKDLSYIRAFQAEGGVDYAKLLLQMPEGYGIFRSREFLRNQPFPCRFLRAYETLQPSELKNYDSISADDTGQRRLLILQIIRERGDVSADDVRLELKKRGSAIEDRTIYRDLEWLEEQKWIVVTDVKERGKKHYGSA